jgi:hypothetical protein
MASRRVRLLPRVWDPALHSAVNTTDGIIVTLAALMITPIGGPEAVRTFGQTMREQR